MILQAERSFARVSIVQEGKFRFINSNAASFAGYTQEELLGREAVCPEKGQDMRGHLSP
jgi:PAS domain S-box-containing protein